MQEGSDLESQGESTQESDSEHSVGSLPVLQNGGSWLKLATIYLLKFRQVFINYS